LSLDCSTINVIGITDETWCADSVNKNCNLKATTLFKLIQSLSAAGGGVLHNLHESLSTTLCIPLMDLGIDDSLWCSVILRDNESSTSNLCCYYSPSSSNDNGRLLSVIGSINNFITSYIQVLLIGDFNIPANNWEDSNYSGSKSSLAASLLDAINNFII